MARTILLTSLNVSETEQPVRYFSAKNEFGYNYCDAILSVEASTKYVLAHYDIDEIIVIGSSFAFDCGDDGRPLELRKGSSFYSSDIRSLSAYSLYRYRIAQYIDELTIEQQEYMELLNPEEQKSVIGYITGFFKGRSDSQEIKKRNRFFDELSVNEQLYNDFEQGLLESLPAAAADPKRYLEWAKNYLYSTLKASVKFDILPVNEDVCVRFIPFSVKNTDGERVDNMLAIADAIVHGSDGKKHDKINLYVSLHSDDATDSFVIMNMLDMMNMMPGSHVQVQKVFTVSGGHVQLTGEIHDDTAGFGITELVAATRAFIRYGKADMIVEFWEKSGERNERIASMIYAMRHIDTGLSMCNIAEVKDGIVRLRELFKDGSFLGGSGYYSRLFNMIANGVRADYGPLLEGDELPFIELVKWAYRHHFYQQTLTLIESLAPEDFVNRGIFYYCNDKEKAPVVTRLMARQRLELKSYEYYKMDRIDHYFIKTYDRISARRRQDRNADSQQIYASVRTRSLENTDPNFITGYTACESAETLEELLYAYYHIGDLRNRINHADDEAMADTRLIVLESDESQALSRMKESIDYFLTSYETASSEIAGKNPNVITITADEVRSCAEEILRSEGRPGQRKENNDKQNSDKENGEKQNGDKQGSNKQ